MTNVNEAGSVRQGPRPVDHSGPGAALNDSGSILRVVQRFQNGEISFEEANQAIYDMRSRMTPAERTALQPSHDAWSRAAAQRGESLRMTDRAERPAEPAAPSPQRVLAGQLRGLPIPPGSTQRMIDMAVSDVHGPFGNGPAVLQTLGRMSPEAVRGAVRAAGFTGEQADRIVAALESRVAGAFAAQVKDQVRQSFDALAQRLSHPSGHALGQLVGELDSDAREATLRGLEALGMSEEALDFLRQYSPPQTDFERAELRRVLREALPACAAAVRAERDAILSGGTLGEITTGDLTRTFPIAAQQVAAGLEINREAVRRDGVDFGRSPTFVERSLMRHLEGAEARHVSGAIAKWLFQRAADVAFGFATGGAGLAGTIAGIGVSAATGQIDVEQARAAHTRAEAGMRAGLTSDADARRAEQAVRQAELDRNVGVASSAVQGAAGGVLDARSSAAANDAVEMVTGPMTDVAASEQPVRVHRLRGGSRGRLEGGE